MKKTTLNSKPLFFILLFVAIFYLNSSAQSTSSLNNQFIKVSARNPRYFETEDGTPWIPVEINYPLFNPANPSSNILSIPVVEAFFKNFAQNGGNSVRLWGGPSDFIEIEDQKIGVYNYSKFKNLDSILAIAKKYNIRVKICLQIARDFKSSYKSPFYKKFYSVADGGPFISFSQYINSDEGRTAYLNRVKEYAKRYSNNPTIYDWELWNEMNAISEGDWFGFTKQMLDSMKVICPKQLSSQSLGSLDGEYAIKTYSQYLTLTNNDIICVHRYTDPGAKLAIVNSPLDQSLSQAVNFISHSTTIKPLFVNETGVVTANHGAFSPDNTKDKSGSMLHDMLFAPFFSGAAGPGSAWFYWAYISPNNLWYHYTRFKHAINGINPIVEKFASFTLQKSNINFYGLAGKNTTIIWCRDSTNNYKTEVEQGISPKSTTSLKLLLRDLKVKQHFVKAQVYNPWTDKWTTLTIVNNTIVVPAFLRSIVIKLS